MASKLFNVRLDDKRLRKARRLRDSGRNLADVVREAIDSEYASLASPRPAADLATIVSDIIERYPDPADLAPREYDVHEARAARAAIVRATKKRRTR